MLIRFRVKNYRSIRDSQVLDLRRAGNGTRSRLAIDDNDRVAEDVTPVAAIYGANASGKSTVLSALEYVRETVRSSARTEAGIPIPVEYFRLDPKSAHSPFECDLVFRHNESDYQYGFEIREGEVAKEYLYQTPVHAPRRNKTMLFSRTGQDITPGARLGGPKATIIRATRPNSLFLSKAAQENHPLLTSVYAWFQTSRNLDSRVAVNELESDEVLRHGVAILLRVADLGVQDLSIERPPTRPPKEFVEDIAKTMTGSDDAAALQQAEEWLMQVNTQVVLSHRGVNGHSYPLPPGLESDGTRVFLNLLVITQRVLAAGGQLQMDEISNLHPLMVRAIIEMFQSQRWNPHGAQLLFTTHDVSLLGDFGGFGYMLDRDQIWFTEKSSEGVTEITPLTDFHPRNTDNIEKAYIMGLFGAIPSLDQLLLER